MGRGGAARVLISVSPLFTCWHFVVVVLLWTDGFTVVVFSLFALYCRFFYPNINISLSSLALISLMSVAVSACACLLASRVTKVVITRLLIWLEVLFTSAA